MVSVLKTFKETKENLINVTAREFGFVLKVDMGVWYEFEKNMTQFSYQ